MLKNYKQYKEENGLGDLKSTTDISGPETELIADVIELLRKNADRFRQIFQKVLRTAEMNTDEENDMKRLIGLIGNLKEQPHEKKKIRDPMDNVVIRQTHGSSGSEFSGGGEE